MMMGLAAASSATHVVMVAPEAWIMTRWCGPIAPAAAKEGR